MVLLFSSAYGTQRLTICLYIYICHLLFIFWMNTDVMHTIIFDINSYFDKIVGYKMCVDGGFFKIYIFLC